MQQAMLYSMLLIMPFSLLSGLTTPISSMPAFVQYLTAINRCATRSTSRGVSTWRERDSKC